MWRRPERLRHTLLVGAEIGRQLTDNFRNTGFFNNTATSILVPLSAPMITTPVTFRQSATDADNHLTTGLGAAYAQDQVEINPHLQIVGGLRFDRFDLTYHDNRSNATLTRPDNLVSPRAGVVVKPIAPLSIYGSYSVSYLPSSGDQFSSLTVITQQVEPERFNNYEVGVKWNMVPSLTMTTALYRLDRTNTRSTDPNDPTRIIQTGSQRTNGYEVALNGNVTPAWAIAGGYAYQNAYVTSATASAAAGAQVGQVPHNTAVALEQLSPAPEAVGRRRPAVSIGRVRGGRQHRHAAGVHARRCGAVLFGHGENTAAAQRREHVRREVLPQRGQQHEHLTRIPGGGPRRPDHAVLGEETAEVAKTAKL